MNEKECPLCIEKFKESENFFYPCPCGYQICSFCFGHLRETDPKCPLCRRPYSPDAATRIGPHFAPESSAEKAAAIVPQTFYFAPKIVQITGFPESILAIDILSQKQYIGQYGIIKKITLDSSKAPSSKPILTSPTKSVYVKFKTPQDAETCCLALDGILIGNQEIRACLCVVEPCPKLAAGKKCYQKDCLKMHRQPRKNDIKIKVSDVEKKPEKLAKLITVPKMPNYNIFPKRTRCLSILPPPRMAPPNYFPFQHTQAYSTKPKVSLENLITTPGYIPPPPPPRIMPNQVIPLNVNLHIVE